MLTRLIDFITENKLFNPQQKILLAVSGGIDSMVMLYLFEKAGFSYGVAHCNFNLRGEESDRDEEFVKQQVWNSGIPLFVKSFDTTEHARLRGISIEMAARELRYEYFESLRKENQYDFIATAHHQDDLIETFFLNLSRKTGIKGLTGIKEKSGYIIRPLLFADRSQIEDYARLHFIDFREDSTNNEILFQRNFFRHRILPLFSELNPSFKNNLLASIDHLKEAEKIYSHTLDEAKKKVVLSDDNETSIQINSLLDIPFAKTLLFEILAEYNFKQAMAEQIFQNLESAPGKQFFSKSHRLVKDRTNLYLVPLHDDEDSLYYIEEVDIELFAPFNLTIEKFSIDDFQIIKSPLVACIDYEKLEFPLLIRKWNKGDYFQPLGMKGFKKISNFFIDEKIPVHQKEKKWLLCSGQKIVWVVGHRLDNRFKITPETRHVLKIELLTD